MALDALKEGVRGYVGNSLVDWDDRSFVIYPDASKLGCGSVLMRHGLDGSFWIIEIDSRTFNALQQKWSPIEHKGFGILRSLLHFKIFILGAMELEVRTDCRPLMFILRHHQRTYTTLCDCLECVQCHFCTRAG